MVIKTQTPSKGAPNQIQSNWRGGTAVLFNFLVIILPGLIIYGAGNRKYKKAMNAPLVAAAKAQRRSSGCRKKLK
jgi:hypothetical protein